MSLIETLTAEINAHTEARITAGLDRLEIAVLAGDPNPVPAEYDNCHIDDGDGYCSLCTADLNPTDETGSEDVLGMVTRIRSTLGPFEPSRSSR